ncbi:carboxypeptidase regulatory-like domain-containing protein [Salegentibacter sp. HM20]
MKTLYSIILSLIFGLFTSCSEDTIGEELTGSISGVVTSEIDGLPLEEVKITTSPSSTTTFTDENGVFLLEGVLVNSYSVRAEKEGFVTAFQGVAVTSNNTSQVVIEMKEGRGNNRAPNAPRLISPEDNSEGQNINLELVWEANDPDGDTLSYDLEIRNDRNNEVLRYSNIRDTVFNVEGLSYGYKYFWQIKASDSINEPVMSEIYSFKTLAYPKTRIFYTRKINGNNVIFARDFNEAEYQLTSEAHNSFRPRKNNRTDKIAFLRTENNQTHLYIMNLDGSEQNRVTGSIPVNGFNLEQIDYSWSDDGESLVYPNFEKLYKVNVQGSGTHLIYQEPSGKFITEVDVSNDNEKIALLVNNASGYKAEIYLIDKNGSKTHTVMSNIEGALGGLNLSVDNKRLLYTRDVSGYESPDYRRLNSRMFIYYLDSGERVDISRGKLEGTNDLDPRFSPNEAEVIFVNTSNDGLSRQDIYTAYLDDQDLDGSHRVELYQDAKMPDWE